MRFEDVVTLIDEHIESLPSGNVKIHEAEELAPKFLVLLNVISVARLELENKRIEHQSLHEVIYRDTIRTVVGKTISEKKIEAAAEEDYRVIREALERIQAKVDYLKANYRIFENAHLFYRQIARGGN